GAFADSATLPEKPLRLLTVIVDVAEWSWERDIAVGLAETPKSTTLSVITTSRLREPLTPVTWMVQVPATVPAFAVTAEDPVPPDPKEIVVGLMEMPAPLGTLGDTVPESVTLPANPPLLLRVIVNEPEVPDCNVRVLGLEDSAKSELTVCTFSLVFGSWGL